MKRFEQFLSHLEVLKGASSEDLSNTFIISGIIDKYFIQFELGWQLFKDLLRHEGRTDVGTSSPREIIKTAYKVYDFLDEDKWLDMLSERNNMAHLYDEDEAKILVDHILNEYIDEFESIKVGLINRYGETFLMYK